MGVLFSTVCVWFGVFLCFICFGMRNANLPYLASIAGLCFIMEKFKVI